MLKEHPILFNGDMVNAILSGKKTQTRRVILPQPETILAWEEWIKDGTTLAFTIAGENEWKCRYASKLGDTLWVRETWAGVDWLAYDCDKDPPETIGYRADKSARYMGTPLATEHWNWDLVKWKPSIHMPKWACRLRLEVTEVRVERVQDITWDDAIAEGVTEDECRPYRINQVEWFEQLWDSINAKRGYSWDSDPWVWVIEFEVVE
jgi:hypothetical protein